MSKGPLSTTARIYLLTVWCEDSISQNDMHLLRFRLDDPRTGERQGFSNPQRLLAFLLTNLGQQEDDADLSTGRRPMV